MIGGDVTPRRAGLAFAVTLVALVHFGVSRAAADMPIAGSGAGSAARPWESKGMGIRFEEIRYGDGPNLGSDHIPASIALPREWSRRLAPYDRGEVLRDGSVRLRWEGATDRSAVESRDASGPAGADGTTADRTEGTLALRPLGGIALVPSASSRVLVDSSPERFAVRFLRWEVPGTGEIATYDVLLLPGGEVRYQYLQVPRSVSTGKRRVRVALEKGDGIERVVPSE